MKFEFQLDKMPITQQQKGITFRNGKFQTYNRRGVQNSELQSLLIQNKPHNSFDKGIPLKLSVTFTTAIKQKKRWWQWKTTRPDLDNQLKNLQDYMTKYGYYCDDSQVVWLDVKKLYGEKTKISIEITEVENEKQLLDC